MLSGIPAVHRNSFEGVSSFCPGGRRRHQRHAPASEPLLRRRQPDPVEMCDLLDGQAFGVVQQHGAAQDEWQAGECILQFFSSGGLRHDYGRGDRVHVVVP
jgi:hypothetical protein